MNKVIILCITLIYIFSSDGIGQSFTDVRIVYPEDTILVNLSDKEVKRIERKTRSYIDEFACDQILFDDSKTYSLDSAQTYTDMQFISAINKIPNNLLNDMVMFCGMNITRKGWHAGIDIGFGRSNYYNNTIADLLLTANGHIWTIVPENSPHATLSIYRYFTDHIAINSGIGLQNYKSTYSLSGDYRDYVYSQDLNLDEYYKSVEAQYDSLLSVSQLFLPICFSYNFSYPGKLGFYFEAGLVFAINLKTRYESSGDYSFYGYYPDHPPTIQKLYIGALGFYKDENIERNGKLSIDAINTSLFASMGISIPVGFYSNVKIGPEIYYGLNDIDQHENYIDIFGHAIERKPTLLKKYGLKLSYVLKL